ncbi:MAG: NUDIX domain-containing protein [Bryobacterales bacterium]|nr:NUDIX domain-containing protein [Bryobacterales bacterium]
MAKPSAGLLLFRKKTRLEVFLVHPGGPFWANKDAGVWSIPKGEYEEGEDALDAARREFTEETGFVADGDFRPLQEIRQAAGKWVKAWAVEGDCDASALRSNTFDLEWPPRSGRTRQFPEVDRGAWFTVDEARQKLNAAQCLWLDELMTI